MSTVPDEVKRALKLLMDYYARLYPKPQISPAFEQVQRKAPTHFEEKTISAWGRD